MKGFEHYLNRCRQAEPEWSIHYMDYNRLKQLLKSYYVRRQRFEETVGDSDDGLATLEDLQLVLGPTAQLTDTTGDDYVSYGNQSLVEVTDVRLRLSIWERDEFSRTLEDELAKAAVYYQDNLLPALQSAPSEDVLLRTWAFCSVAVVTFRQALVRYEAFRQSVNGMPLSEWHLQRSILAVDHPVHELFGQSALRQLSSGEDDEHVQFLQSILDKSDRSLQRAADSHDDPTWRNHLQSMGQWIARLGGRELQLEPTLLANRGRTLRKEIKYLARWQESRWLPAKKEDSLQARWQQMDPRNVFPLVLNLASCFLYMQNNYIIEPSSAYYANALGSSDALSGIMIGAGPWFALISAVVYSYWTNYSYKTPILVSATLMMLGNLLYASAYSYESMTLCLIGRALTGLGAPRVINRRYVADGTPFSLRTMASAAFAMATALGAALGPGMAIVLDWMPEFEFYLPLLGQQYFNGMTGPGYFMAVAWLIFIVSVVWGFQEPVRSGLAELLSQEEDENDYDSGDDDSVYSDAAGLKPVRQDATYCGSALCPCFQHLTRAVILCMSLIFMKRIALESIVGSTSVITKNRYGWSIRNVGTLHLVNGIIVIPVSAVSGWLSTFREDRYLSLWFLVVTLVGMLFMIDFSDFFDTTTTETYNEGSIWAVGEVKYVTGSLIAFSGIEACESYVASLMSKVVPSALASGTFNSGLLATLVGTGGRATGDLFITLMGLISIRNLLNLLIIPGASLICLSIFLIRANYDVLEV